MASQTSDRQRMSNDLRELARLAKPVPPGGPANPFERSEGSGRVDLATLMATDNPWTHPQVARARSSAPPAGPWAAPATLPLRAIHTLSPQTMAPVAIQTFDEDEAIERMRGRSSGAARATHALLGIAAVGVVGFLAFTLAKHPPPPAVAEATATVAPAAAPLPAAPLAPPVTTVAAAASPVPPPTPVAALPTPDSLPVAVSTTAPARSKKRTFSAVRPQQAAPAVASPPPAVARAAVVVPAPRPAADPLMDLIKKSVAAGK